MIKKILLLCLFTLSACSQDPSDHEASTALAEITESSHESRPPNFLILIADDMGVDSLSEWGEHERNASTATISNLAKEGMRFDQFWTQPVCSPMRVTAMTGRYTFRHGVQGPLWSQAAHIGVPIPEPKEEGIPSLDFSPMGGIFDASKLPFSTEDPLPGQAPKGPSPDELYIPAVLKSLDKGYATAAFGKWHMADRENGWLNHPNNMGIDHFSGPLAGDIKYFSAWQHVENGVPRQEFGYVDQHSTDNAIDWIQHQDNPWFVWFSFINPHEPFHKPPVELIQSEELKSLDPLGMTEENTPTYFKAMVEAMDSLSGQIIASIPEEQMDNTYIIWLGDNGDELNSRPVEERRPNRWKMTNYQGGANVPFIIKGPGIKANSVNSSLAHVVDIFATVLELAGGDASKIADRKIDSVSLAGELFGDEASGFRDWNFTDVNVIGGPAQAIRNQQYKLIRTQRGDEFYDLLNDPKELNNLVETDDEAIQRAYASLSEQLVALLATEPEANSGE